MTTTPQSAATRRRFRFGLRTLLVVVSLAAVASWGYWVAWPWWQAYREQIEFEAAVRQLKVGDPNLINGNHLPRLNNDSMYASGDGISLTLLANTFERILAIALFSQLARRPLLSKNPIGLRCRHIGCGTLQSNTARIAIMIIRHSKNRPQAG